MKRSEVNAIIREADQFIRQRSDPAFTALLERHGPMVLSVCRRMLYDPRDVEDAFQATFLSQASSAGR